MSALGDRLERVISYGKGIDPGLVGKDYVGSEAKENWDEYARWLLRPVVAPIIWVARAAVWMEDGGPTLIALPRIGKGGEEFDQFKVRSMRVEAQHQPHQFNAKTAEDPRVTRVGAYLRPRSADELGQIRNLGRGGMSLVGPRPQPRVEVDEHSQMSPAFYDAYIRGRPGITGLEQIRGRGDLTPEQRILCVEEYAETASPELDRYILRATFRAVLSRHGAY